MGIRDQLNLHPALSKGAAVAVAILAGLCVFWELRSGAGPAGRAPTGRYFSDDDGASYYTDSLTLLPPYDHDGKQAVIANVFRCGDGKPFIAFLQRYTPKGLKAEQNPSPNQNSADLEMNESEVSVPLAGESGWMKVGSKTAQALMNNLKCPSGKSDDLEPVQP